MENNIEKRDADVIDLRVALKRIAAKKHTHYIIYMNATMIATIGNLLK